MIQIIKSQNAPPSVLIDTHHTQYLVNVPEGFQRTMAEYNVRLNRLAVVFVFGTDPRFYMGLPGLLLTLNHQRNTKLIIVCAPKARSYIERLSFSLYIPNVEIKYGCVQDSQGEYTSYVNEEISTQLISSKRNDQLRIRFSDRMGKFNPVVAEQMGVPPGPLYAKLKRNEEVVVNGKTVKPSEVKEKDEPGSTVLIESRRTMDLADYIFYYTEDLVLNRKILQEKRSDGSFRELKAENLINELSLNNLDTAFRLNTCSPSSNEILPYELKIEDKKTGRLLLEKNHENQNEQSSTNGSDNKENTTTVSDPLQAPHSDLLDKCTTEKYVSCTFSPDVVKNIETLLPLGIHKDPKVVQLLTDNELLLRDFVRRQNCYTTIDASYRLPFCTQHLRRFNREEERILSAQNNFRITFLGTASQSPGKYRNVSGILIELYPENFILLDCGEGTLTQILMLEDPQRILRSLRIVFISHSHGDHHFGLLSVLSEAKKLGNNDVFIVADANVLKYVSSEFKIISIELSDVCRAQGSYCRITSKEALTTAYEKTSSIPPNRFRYTIEYRENDIGCVVNLLNINIEFSSICVEHCPGAHAIKISIGDSSIVYSGDTRPIESFKLFKDCLLLIHEATYDDNMQQEARNRSHSTVSDAVSVKEMVGASYLIMTHFSHRHDVFRSTPPRDSAFAFDLWSVDRGGLEKMHEKYISFHNCFKVQSNENELSSTEDTL